MTTVKTRERLVEIGLLLASCLVLSAGCAGACAFSTGARADATIVERVDALGAIDPDARYLFYLHPKIVEEQGLPAVTSPCATPRRSST